jgi:hypothetical protein
LLFGFLLLALNLSRVCFFTSHHHGKAAGFSTGGFNVPYANIPNGAANGLPPVQLHKARCTSRPGEDRLFNPASRRV